MLGIARTEGIVRAAGHKTNSNRGRSRIPDSRLARLVGWLKTLPRTERFLLFAAMALALAVRLVYVRATLGHALAGDENVYDSMARFTVHGHFMWTDTLYGYPHPTMSKPPLYPMFVAGLYKVFGENPDHALTAQTLVGPLVVFLTWMLARRLFGPRVAIAAAFVVAVYPLAWQYEARLYSEALATPLVLVALDLLVEREPTPKRALILGLVLGLLILTRPALGYLIVGAAVAWTVTAGWRRGLTATTGALVVAVLVVMPWMVRNDIEYHEFPLVSLSDASVAAGTFNDDSANYPRAPYAWRAVPRRDAPLYDRDNRMPENRLRSKLFHNAAEFIRRHPDSVPKAFFWNGLSRFWDVRSPHWMVDDVRYEGRTRLVAGIGVPLYWLMLSMAVVALFALRHRRAVVLPVLAIALAASVVHTTAGLTRYRSVLEPLIVILACAGAAALLAARKRAGAGRPSAAVPA
jgi:4-amino-4-deoxy-L-arabinose transferase-like glycosyltransferase